MIVRTAPVPWLTPGHLSALAASARHDVVWLDSAVGDARRGRRSLFAWELETRARIDLTDNAQQAWNALDARFAVDAAGAGAHPDLGWVGVVTYEAAELADGGMPAATPGAAAVRMAAVRAAVVVDDDGARLVASGSSDLEADRALERLSAAVRAAELAPPPAPYRLVDDLGALRRWHAAAVRDVLARIEEGRVYQACLTFPLRLRGDAALAVAYAALRSASPGDYGAYVRLGGIEAASSSPERFLAIDGRAIEARPMKGTRPRGASASEDDAHRLSLRGSAKDRAENVMIVDLVRNDLGRVCEVGSVHVPELYTVETYDTVHQMTSTVRGTLRAEVGPFEALAAAFPPGSMTGAPKIAACELLRRLERGPRQLYAGSVVRLGYDGRHNTSVVIRTLQRDELGLRYDVGGGIVADSTPDEEWAEAITKAQALVRAGLLTPFDADA